MFNLQGLYFLSIHVSVSMFLCVSEGHLFTLDGEVLRPQTVHDVIQEEALLRQGAANEAVTLQGVIQDAAQNCTHFLSLVW